MSDGYYSDSAKRYTTEQKSQMASLYESGMTISEVANEFGCSAVTVSAALKVNSVKGRTLGKHTRQGLARIGEAAFERRSGKHGIQKRVKTEHEKNRMRLLTRMLKAEVRLKALSHYGVNGVATCCVCLTSDIDVLTLDHIDNSGAEHRRKDKTACQTAYWCVKNGMPSGFQTLCRNCNYKKYLIHLRARLA